MADLLARARVIRAAAEAGLADPVDILTFATQVLAEVQRLEADVRRLDASLAETRRLLQTIASADPGA